MRRVILAGCFLCCVLFPARGLAERWTNQAGHTVEATLADYKAGQVTLIMTNGATLRLPLSSLCAADQRRVRVRYNESIAPAYVQTAYRDARAVLVRFEHLSGGKEKPEDRARVGKAARAVFDERIAAHADGDLDPAVRKEIARLRKLLK